MKSLIWLPTVSLIFVLPCLSIAVKDEALNCHAFIIFPGGDGLYKAKDSATGEVVFSNADASRVIEYALNNTTASGGNIVLREGIYKLHTPVVLSKPYLTPVNITIIGYGAKLKVMTHNQCGLVFNGCENLTVKGLKIEGRGDETVEVNLIRILGCRSVLLRDISLNKGWDLIAIDSWSTDPDYPGIAPCDYPKASDLIYLENIKATKANRDGVYCFAGRVFMRDMFCCGNSFGIESGARYLELDRAVLIDNYGWHGVWSWGGEEGVRITNVRACGNKYHGVCVTNPTNKSIRDIIISNVECFNNGQTGLMVQNTGAQDTESGVVIENVVISNVILRDNARLEPWPNLLINGVHQKGIIRNVTLNNIIIEERNGVDHDGLEISSAINVVGSNIIVKGHPRSGIVIRDGVHHPTNDVLLQDLIIDSNHNGVYVRCANTGSILIRDCIMKNNDCDFVVPEDKLGGSLERGQGR
ncbi:hypothetical protein J7M22_17810 [Candidatus Poribacteria bacterium]|nr:hypothetical protein [Candidatus Poribacteria bacterium]